MNQNADASQDASGDRDDRPNRVLGLVAILIAVAIVALLVGGGIYWWITPSQPSLPGIVVFRGTPANRIQLEPGALKDWNVLLVSADTTRADRIGCYGNAQIRTPTIDGLARQGVLFQQAITPVPITLPGHTSMLTGLIPPHHGVRSNGLFRLRDGVETLGQRLKRHGYATGAVIGAYVLDTKFGLNRGFDMYNDDVSGGDSPTQFGYRERRAAQVNEPAIAWLREHAGGKFFLFVHYFDPHLPYDPPEPWRQQYASNPYDGEIAYVDAELSRLLSALEELGVRQRTLVIFTSDHGESLGEHGEKTHAMFIYDATQHIPLIFSGPAPFPQNRVVSRQVGTVDIVPTVLATLGLPALEGADGTSLLDVPSGSTRSVYIETLYPKFSHNWSPLLGIRHEDYKYIHAPQPELYDLRADPRELNNLYDSKRRLASTIFNELRAVLGNDPSAVSSVKPTLTADAATRARLLSLGYVISGATSGPTSGPWATSGPTTSRAEPLPDPKDMIKANLILVAAQNKLIERQYAEAEEQVRAYLALSPRDAEGLHVAGQIYRQLGKLDESLACFRKAATYGHEAAESWAGVGSIHVLKGDLEKGRSAYRQALDIDPRSTTALIGMGSVDLQEGREDEALKRFRYALECGRGINAGMAYLGISNVHRKAGRVKEAGEYLAKALDADPTNPVIAEVAASFSQATGNPTEAIERLRKAAAEKPSADLLLKLGRLLNQEKQYDQSERYLRQGIALSPNSAELHCELGTSLAARRQVQDAAKAYMEALRLDPSNADALSRAGLFLAQTGQFQAALPVMRRAVASRPNSGKDHYNLGLVYANLGAYEEGIKSLRRSIELNPRFAKAYCKLGQVLAAQGKQAEAIPQYQKALELDPGDEEAKSLLKAAGGS
ncbi:MAG: sulfatase-like hydrolase/transferase [Phycisphaerae bacterium]|nr:sulfatase-like hydrolase/transferase [Phycisphaerae bacterium]